MDLIDLMSTIDTIKIINGSIEKKIRTLDENVKERKIISYLLQEVQRIPQEFS